MEEFTQTPASTDDMHVMRYLMHTIQGISPVSGGMLSQELVQEYALIDSADSGSEDTSL